MEPLFIAVIAVCISYTDCEIIEANPVPLEQCEVLLHDGVVYVVQEIQKKLPDVVALSIQFDCVEVDKT